MDSSKVEKIVNKNISKMQAALGVSDWDVIMSYYGTDHAGEVRFRPGYRSAYITLDPSRLMSKGEVLNVLRHELIHLLAAELDIYRNTFMKFVSDQPRTIEAMEELYDSVVEKLVGNIERVLDYEPAKVQS